MFVIIDDDARNAFRNHPYSWMLLFIPIAGIVGFYGVVTDENINRRWRELDARKNHKENLKKEIDEWNKKYET